MNPSNIAAHFYKGENNQGYYQKTCMRYTLYCLVVPFQFLFLRMWIPQLSPHNLIASLYQ